MGTTLLRKVTKRTILLTSQNEPKVNERTKQCRQTVFACLTYKDFHLTPYPSNIPTDFWKHWTQVSSDRLSLRFIFTFFKNTDFYLFIVNRLKIQHKAISLQKSLKYTVFPFKRMSQNKLQYFCKQFPFSYYWQSHLLNGQIIWYTLGHKVDFITKK